MAAGRRALWARGERAQAGASWAEVERDARTRVGRGPAGPSGDLGRGERLGRPERGKEKSGLRGVGLGLPLGLGFVGFSSLFISKLFYS